MWDYLKNWYAAPFKPQQDAGYYFLTLGAFLVGMILWRLILRNLHIGSN